MALKTLNTVENNKKVNVLRENKFQFQCPQMQGFGEHSLIYFLRVFGGFRAAAGGLSEWFQQKPLPPHRAQITAIGFGGNLADSRCRHWHHDFCLSEEKESLIHLFLFQSPQAALAKEFL